MAATMGEMTAPRRNRRQGFARATRQGARALFAMIARSLQQVSTLVITLLAARFLAPGDYGVYSLAIVFIILIQTLTYTGFYQFILTSREPDEAVLSTCFWLILGLVGAASALLALAAWPLQWLFQAPDLGGVILLLALLQPLAGIGAWSSAALLRRGAAMLNFRIMFAQNLLALVGGAALVWTWHSLYALVAFRAIRVLSGALLYAFLARDCPQLRFDVALARGATRFSAGLYGSRGLGFLAQYAADLLLGLLHSPTAVGLYRFGNRVATGITDTAMQPMASFAAMQMGAAARKGHDLSATLARFSGTLALAAGMLGAGIIVLADDMIALFFQPSYAAGLLVTYAMALRALAGAGKLLIEPAFAALGRTTSVMYFNLVTSLVAVAAVFAASPWGLAALAWAQVGVVAASTLYAFALLSRRGRLDVWPSLRNLALALLLCANFGLLLGLGCHGLEPLLPPGPLPALGGRLAFAALLALPTLALALRLRVLDLSVFSG